VLVARLSFDLFAGLLVLRLQFLATQERRSRSKDRRTEPTGPPGRVRSASSVRKLGNWFFFFLFGHLVAAVLGAGSVVAAAGPGAAILITLAEFRDSLADALEAGRSFRAAVVRILFVDAALDIAAEPGTADTCAAIGVEFAGLAFLDALRLRLSSADTTIEADQTLAASRVSLARLTFRRAKRLRLRAHTIDTNQTIAAFIVGITHLTAWWNCARTIDALKSVSAALSTLGAAVPTLARAVRFRKLAGFINTFQAILATREADASVPEEAKVTLATALRLLFFTDTLLVAESGATDNFRSTACRYESAEFANVGTRIVTKVVVTAHIFGTARKLGAIGAISKAPCPGFANGQVCGKGRDTSTDHPQNTAAGCPGRYYARQSIKLLTVHTVPS
jgi:hypothetical protein